MSEICEEATRASDAIWQHVNETWNSNKKQTSKHFITCLVQAAMEERERRIASGLVNQVLSGEQEEKK